MKMETENRESCISCAVGDPHFHVYIATIIVITGFIWFFFISGNERLLPLVVITGMGGGVISIYMRLRGSGGGSVYSGAMVIPKMQVYISTLVAGMLALLFHGFMAAGLVTGEIFPEFRNSADSFGGVSSFLASLSPNTNSDAAKTVVWAFVAGFSERLVPNVLDTLGKKGYG